MKIKTIDIPFGANDSELKGWEYTIPEGMEAIVQDGKVVVRQKESEDEIHRKWILEYLYDGLRKADEQFKGQFKSAIEWLEKQKEEEGYEAIPVESTLEYKLGFKAGKESEKQKEQKPVNNSASTMIPSCWSDENGEPKYKKEDYFCERCQANAFNAGRESVLKEPKPAEWSEEDEKMLKEALYCVGYTFGSTHPLVAWLKSLSLNLKKKNEDVAKLCSNEWNEEDALTIADLINYFEGDSLECSAEEMVQRIKSLRPSWKPSEEQMKALEEVIEYCPEGDAYDILSELISDLKKL